MILVVYSIIILFFLLAKFTELFNNSEIAYSISSTLLFFIMYILNFELNKNTKKTIFLTSLLYLIYDFIFSFFIGVNVVAWNMANIFFTKVKKVYDINVKTLHFVIYSYIFFLTSWFLNYITNNVENIQILIYQLSISTIGSVLIIKLFGKRKDNFYQEM